MRTRGMMLLVGTNQNAMPTIRRIAARFIQCRPGRVSGRDGSFSESLPHATIEPVKVTAPMKMPMYTSARWNVSAEPSR